MDVKLANMQRATLTKQTHVLRRVLNAGSGFQSDRQLHPVFSGNKWQQVSVDIDPHTKPNIVSSITDLNEFVLTGSFDAVWCSHTLEHLFAHEVPMAISEFRRSLKQDGFALIRSPDLEAAAALIVKHGIQHIAYQSPAGPITPLEMLFGHTASIARGRTSMGHKTGFTSASLGKLLLDGGFTTVFVKQDNFDLWALAITENANEEKILNNLLSTGLDLINNRSSR
jgi:hypothetical protein